MRPVPQGRAQRTREGCARLNGVRARARGAHDGDERARSSPGGEIRSKITQPTLNPNARPLQGGRPDRGSGRAGCGVGAPKLQRFDMKRELD